jgi:UDP-2-acetamido-3-amino-2,3-dideoxy-glucuronate N-acetyltransferase
MSESKQPFFAHPTAIIDDGAKIGDGTKVWHFSHVYPNAIIGEGCSFGQNTMVASGVTIGGNVKVQNNVAIYAGTTIEDDVFLGPSCVLTNISNPRSQVIRKGVYETTLIRRGATIGANSTIVCGIELGSYCFIAAGAVVTKSVQDYAMIAGVPGRQVGWMSRHGHRLKFDNDGMANCPESGYQYQLENTNGMPFVKCLNIAENQSLPESKSVGHKSYREFK